MAKARSLNPVEVARMKGILTCVRDQTMFMLGLFTGYRIKEILSLYVGDVLKDDEIVTEVTVHKTNMKGKRQARPIVLPEPMRNMLAAYIIEAGLTLDSPLFPSRKGFNLPITKFRAWKIIKEAARKLDLPGKVATHSMRRTFCNRMYTKLNKDIMKLSKLMYHSTSGYAYNNTAAYIEVDQAELNQAVMSNEY